MRWRHLFAHSEHLPFLHGGGGGGGGDGDVGCCGCGGGGGGGGGGGDGGGGGGGDALEGTLPWAWEGFAYATDQTDGSSPPRAMRLS